MIKQNYLRALICTLNVVCDGKRSPSLLKGGGLKILKFDDVLMTVVICRKLKEWLGKYIGWGKSHGN